MKKLILSMIAIGTLAIAVPVNDADAAAKHKRFKHSEMTQKQRAAFMENARKVCKKKFGAASHVNQIDYARQKIWCD